MSIFHRQTFTAATIQLTGDQTVKVWRAPVTGEIVDLRVGRQKLTDTPTTINTTDYFKLIVYDAGSSGTGTAVIGSRGGKSTSWTALQLYALITEGGTAHKLDKGDSVNLKFDESGTVALGSYFVVGTFAPGIVDG